ncbi:DGQHR domain-containing protein [Bacillus cereus]|nr:DGQHR domain-containing protein [Bacillus cereus]MCU5457144.1 DGQHR domain-containing protein [Bacillus cereus]MCU5547053.1 DGQHR domain-containing protein [Bacillus cereus]MCU5677595.1 DGQHR domain-containing protein [Bacillus cereus]
MSKFKNSIQLLEVSQPIGTFYIGVIKASLLKKISIVNRRVNNIGYQREASIKRINEIKKFTEDIDAVFPTPIVLSVNNSIHYSLENNIFQFDDDSPIVEIIDGQHRTAGIFDSSKINEFQLPIILLFDLTEEEKAYIFSTINSKQTKVSMSLIYDLFSISENRSPQKTCHEIVRLLNTDLESPFYKRLKMLGKKEGEASSLSQGSFIKYLLPLISRYPDEDLSMLKKNPNASLENDPRCPLRYYFIKQQDEIIYKILLNLFNALQDTFPIEWENHKTHILAKTTGYGAVMRAFPKLYELGLKNETLTYKFFIQCFENFKRELKNQNKQLTSEFFPSNEQEQKKLSNIILLANNLIDNDTK